MKCARNPTHRAGINDKQPFCREPKACTNKGSCPFSRSSSKPVVFFVTLVDDETVLLDEQPQGVASLPPYVGYVGPL